MGYQNSNAAYAYDMRAEFQAPVAPYAPAEPEVRERPRLDVVTGAGREANQEASPAFVHVAKVFCVVVAMFFAIGIARVTISGMTASILNGNATLNASLESAREQSENLEVMRSVYGAHTRIRDLAAGTLGMVESDGSVVLDFTQEAPAAADAQ
ncbi:MAG: hypothetical protein SOU51_04760 [Collinsella sp.]|nr:hypothetical protein [Collinsella sp.]